MIIYPHTAIAAVSERHARSIKVQAGWGMHTEVISDSSPPTPPRGGPEFIDVSAFFAVISVDICPGRAQGTTRHRPEFSWVVFELLLIFT